MSLNRETQERIIKYILEQIDKDVTNLHKKVMDTFSVSDTSVRRYIRKLEENLLIQKSTHKKCRYSLTSKDHVCHLKNENLEEHMVYKEHIYPVIEDLPENIKHIWIYSFTEMMNNAIEHSKAKDIYINISRNALSTEIAILDNGIGIFNNIISYIKNVRGIDITVEDAMTELFVGKLTTAEANHSGEGIFFTSRMMDEFFILSSDAIFTHNNIRDFSYSNDQNKKSRKEDSVENEILQIGRTIGTLVLLKLSNHSDRTTEEVFDMFAPADSGFVKTSIPVKNTCCEFGYPVSRSQARRLCSRLDEFEEVTFDFNGVTNIGQAFVHEIFVVYQRNHPALEIKVVNANKVVEEMISRVLKTSEM